MPGMVKNRFFLDLERKGITVPAAFLKGDIIPFKII